MNLIPNEDGIYSVTFKTQKDTTGKVCLGTKDEEQAKLLVKRMRVEDLETVSGIVDLTHQVVTQIVAGKEVTVSDAITRWYEHVSGSRILSPTTIRAHHITLMAWARDTNVADTMLTSVTSKSISDFVNTGGEQRTSAVRKLAAIRSFFGFCNDEGLSYRNPASTRLVKVAYDVFKHEEKEAHVRTPFTPEEITRLLAVADEFWTAAIVLSRDTGLRLGDIAALQWSSFVEDRLIVWTDKANKRVDVPITDAIFKAVGALSETSIEVCFPAQKSIIDDPKRRALLSVQFGRLCIKAGIEGRSFHCLRHTNATNLVTAGSNLQQVATLLGHSSTDTTQGYVHNS